jgi:hypothetical protein
MHVWSRSTHLKIVAFFAAETRPVPEPHPPSGSGHAADLADELHRPLFTSGKSDAVMRGCDFCLGAIGAARRRGGRQRDRFS